ncbi:Crp/Fnr family transcriptional regulator [Mucilaginibacter sp.]
MEQLKAVINAISPMPEDDFWLLAPLIKSYSIKKKAHLLQQGQVCRHIWFLQQGVFRMYYADEAGNQITYRFATAGHFFVDFQSFITQQPSHYHWQALTSAEVLAFAYEDVQQLYRRSAAWERFGRLVAERVYLELNERVEMLQLLSPWQRYQHLLRTRPGLSAQVSQQHLASYLGIKPESLSRLRRRMLHP